MSCSIAIPSKATSLEMHKVVEKLKKVPAKYKRKYKYTPLATNGARLLIVHPQSESGDTKEHIHATIAEVSFDQLGQVYPFEALSYHWGPDEDHRPIYIHNDRTQYVPTASP